MAVPGCRAARAQGVEEASRGVLVWEGLSGTASAEEEQDHPVCDRSQELSGMCDPEITLTGALAPKDPAAFLFTMLCTRQKTNKQQSFIE